MQPNMLRSLASRGRQSQARVFTCFWLPRYCLHRSLYHSACSANSSNHSFHAVVSALAGSVCKGSCQLPTQWSHRSSHHLYTGTCASICPVAYLHWLLLIYFAPCAGIYTANKYTLLCQYIYIYILYYIVYIVYIEHWYLCNWMTVTCSPWVANSFERFRRRHVSGATLVIEGSSFEICNGHLYN